LVNSNASREHKLKLTFIGKSKNPRAFTNVNVKNLPVNYANQKMHGWIQVCLKYGFMKTLSPAQKIVGTKKAST
jgi:hypothetical protein